MVSKKYVFGLLVCITLLGGFFRFINLNWDYGLGFHPDELNIAIAVTNINLFSKFNPDFFQYGTSIIYLNRLIGQIVTIITSDVSWVEQYGYITYIGRHISAVLSTITIPLIFFYVAIEFGIGIALLTSLFIACAPLLIQNAHYSTTDTLLTLLGFTVYFLSKTLQKKSSMGIVILTSFVMAFALSIKASGLFFICMPLFALIFNNEPTRPWFNTNKRSLLKGIYFLLCVAAAYIIISPMTLVALSSYIDGMIYEKGVVSGVAPVFYTFQFAGTIPYIYPLSQLPYTLGFIPTIFGLIGVVVLIIRSIKQRTGKYFMILGWILFYFSIVGSWHVKFVRYMMPLFPFLSLIAAIFITKGLQLVKSRRKQYVVVGSIIGITLLQALAFVAIYTHPQTRLQALSWIESETPEHAILLTDDASEFLPETSEEELPEEVGRYIKQIPHFGLESDEEIIALAQWLATSDYYIIGTRRQLGVAQNNPEQFPRTSHFYDLLFTDAIGYEYVAQFSSYPSLSLFGNTITFPDDTIEETFQVFDHPTIFIFQNTQNMSKDIIFNALTQLE